MSLSGFIVSLFFYVSLSVYTMLLASLSVHKLSLSFCRVNVYKVLLSVNTGSASVHMVSRSVHNI